MTKATEHIESLRHFYDKIGGKDPVDPSQFHDHWLVLSHVCAALQDQEERLAAVEARTAPTTVLG